MHINFTVFENRRGHEIVRAERESYKREDKVYVSTPVFACPHLCCHSLQKLGKKVSQTFHCKIKLTPTSKRNRERVLFLQRLTMCAGSVVAVLFCMLSISRQLCC